MGSKWCIYRLGDIAEFSYGKMPKKEFVGTGDYVIFSGYKYTESYPEKNTSAGELIVVARGVGGTGDVKITTRDCYLTNLSIKINLDETKVRKEYFYYLFLQSNLRYLDSGSAQSQITINDLANVEISAPSLNVQDLIVKSLKAFDDKITTLSSMNQTLEQMSQTLFKSWFVDFDPVIDNALDAGNPIPEALQARAELRQKVRNSADFKPLPAEIRSLFPSEFEETELGWVPKTWTISNLGKEFNITMGQSPSGSTYNEDRVGLPFFQGKTDFGFRFPSERIYCTDPKRVANKLDTLLSVRAPVGVTNLASTECIIGRGLAALRHKSGNIAFTYYSVSNLSDYFSVFNGEGTVFGSINQKDLKQLPLICPPTELINKFEELSGKWEEKIFLHCGEIENLSKLRDTLLPKLISGELSLEDLPDLSTDTEAA
ncbi:MULTISPECIES: restriction endonuclease subunit S [Enterobacteriaceae]|uniref:restriction endonuclease subunit S n=1 Tax=Enterobacteriaceae TaxID=543 RepID=UPI001299F0A8|nr:MULTISPECIES: restriction endonuclease subunit S [Enterobacteriaceae]EFL9906524.1 restriction endonuclease subunit S [Escherichia coli]EIX2069786.1 restriction endonuclease subunit S [Escherichia coli]EJU9661363.1 restriction endonuclease subunit S [Escherichia coli]EKG5190884.1 restriction endonuclease subunit S [Escherichia coli]ELA5637051.1 restriction endonuclease subunit S [Escherichia coli]